MLGNCCALNAQKMSLMRAAYARWGKELVLPKLGPYNVLHLQPSLHNINKQSDLGMKTQNMMWFQLCTQSPNQNQGAPRWHQIRSRFL